MIVRTATTCHQLDTSQLLAGAAAVLTLGDNQYNAGELTNYAGSFGASWGAYKNVMHPVPGNHEYGTANAQGYRDYFGYDSTQPLYYSYDVGAWHMVALNSETTTAPGSPQEVWLRADLAAHPTSCTLAYWHKPLFSSGDHGANALAQPLWDDLYAAGADVVLSGHDHDYERFAPQAPDGTLSPTRGIREFIVGTGGKSHASFPTVQPNSQVRDNTTYGVLRLTLHATSYDWRFVPEAGGTFTDAGSGDCVSPGGNTTPTARSVSLSASSDQTSSWTPNISDPDPGTQFICSIVSQPANGTATVASDGSNGIYTPNVGFTGTDAFTYDVSDGTATSSPATVSVSVSSGVPAAISLVQQTVVSGTAVSLGLPLLATRAGDAVVASIALAAGSSASVATVVDSTGVAWTKGPAGFLSGANSRVEIWYRLGAPPITGVTVTLSASKILAVNVTEWSGLGSVVDAAVAGSGLTSMTVSTPLLMTPRAPELLIGAVDYPAVVTSTLASGPWTELSAFNGGTAIHGRAAYVVVSSTGSFKPSWSLSAPSGGNGGVAIAFAAGP